MKYDYSRISFVETIVEFMDLFIGLAFFLRSKTHFFASTGVGVNPASPLSVLSVVLYGSTLPGLFVNRLFSGLVLSHSVVLGDY